MWFKFESKIRDLVAGMLEPVIEMSQDDRLKAIQLVYKSNELDDRCKALEQATFKTDLYKNPTYIQTLDQRLEELEKYSKRELQRNFDECKNNSEMINNRIFVFE